VKRFVVDASVAIKWLIKEPETPQALRLAAHSRLIAPDLLTAEFANVLRTKIRAGEFDLELVEEAADVLHSAGLTLVPMEPLMTAAIRIAHRLQHPAYDCFYLALALAEGCAFVTADARLIRKLADPGHADLRGSCLSLTEAVSGATPRL
jgi:predicted nucleic acid-binding protein